MGRIVKILSVEVAKNIKNTSSKPAIVREPVIMMARMSFSSTNVVPRILMLPQMITHQEYSRIDATRRATYGVQRWLTIMVYVPDIVRTKYVD